jgi:hypothetical protein
MSTIVHSLLKDPKKFQGLGPAIEGNFPLDAAVVESEPAINWTQLLGVA